MTTPMSGIVRLDRRSQLLLAAAELFAEHGYANTSIDAIGARAGVTGPAVYRHFSNKRDLLMTLLGEAIETALAGVEEATTTTTAPFDNLEAMVRQVVSYSIERRRVVGLLFAQHGNLAAVDREQIGALRDRAFKIWADAFRLARPEVSEEDVRLHVGAAMAVLSTISRQLPPQLSGKEEAVYVRMLMSLLTA